MSATPFAPPWTQIANMWCETCQATVGHDSDSQPDQCPRCASTLVQPPKQPDSPTDSPPATPPDATQQAQDLLNRWNNDDPLQVVTPAKDNATDKQPDTPNYRVDAAHPTRQTQPEIAPAPASSNPLDTVATTLAGYPEQKPPQPSNAPTRTDSPQHDQSPSTDSTAPAKPPVESPAKIPAGTTTSRLTHSTSLWGQLLAYVGVLGLTAGGALIVWNGFGHAPLNTPTAWLIATGGQMLLFLGIVTLVSSGLEQTNEDVNRQIDELARGLSEQLSRIEMNGSGRYGTTSHSRHTAANTTDSRTTQPARSDTTSITKPK